MDRLRAESERWHYALAGRIAEFLLDSGRVVESHAYDPQNFGHWSITFTNSGRRLQLFYDGRESRLEIWAEREQMVDPDKPWRHLEMLKYSDHGLKQDALEHVARELITKFLSAAR
jgi:hypothetical protein